MENSSVNACLHTSVTQSGILKTITEFFPKIHYCNVRSEGVVSAFILNSYEKMPEHIY